MTRRNSTIKKSAGKAQIFRHYGWDVSNPTHNSRYRRLKSAAIGAWHIVLGGISPNARLEDRTPRRTGHRRPSYFALVRDKLHEQIRGQAEEERLLRDTKGLINHVVWKARREYWNSSEGRTRSRRDKKRATMCRNKPSNPSVAGDDDEDMLDLDRSPTSSLCEASDKTSITTDEDQQLQGSHANLLHEAAQAGQLPNQYPPGRDHLRHPSSKFFVIPKWESTPPPSSAPSASLPTFSLPSLGESFGSSATVPTWEPISPSLLPSWYSPFFSSAPPSNSIGGPMMSPRLISTPTSSAPSYTSVAPDLGIGGPMTFPNLNSTSTSSGPVFISAAPDLGMDGLTTFSSLDSTPTSSGLSFASAAPNIGIGGLTGFPNYFSMPTSSGPSSTSALPNIGIGGLTAFPNWGSRTTSSIPSFGSWPLNISTQKPTIDQCTDFSSHPVMIPNTFPLGNYNLDITSGYPSGLPPYGGDHGPLDTGMDLNDDFNWPSYDDDNSSLSPEMDLINNINWASNRPMFEEMTAPSPRDTSSSISSLDLNEAIDMD